MANLHNIIKIDEFSSTPKYQQLANAILIGIEQKFFKKGSIMPSINEVSFEFDISRMTVEKGYNHLKSLGVLDSVPGKGYYIKDADFHHEIKILLLFNKLSAHKKIIYDSLISTLDNKASIDFYIYNNDFDLFRKLISQHRIEDYTHVAIIPHFTENEDKAHELIETLPKNKLMLVDKIIPHLGGKYGAVYENFEKDIYNALVEVIPQLQKYKNIKLIFPGNSYFPKEIIKGLATFCADHAFELEIINNLANETIQKGTVYINLMEDDLVTLIEDIGKQQLKVGEDVGIISYNETPLKRFILNGLTTISTDFEAIGRITAQQILDDSRRHIEVPFNVVLRNSL